MQVLSITGSRAAHSAAALKRNSLTAHFDRLPAACSRAIAQLRREYAVSGFVVELRKDYRPADPDLHDAMRRTLRIFGSDRDNVADHGRFTLIWAHDTGFTPHDRLERQPVSGAGEVSEAADNRWQLVFIGCLMHRENLARELALSGPEADRLPDSALVMRAWQQWGEDCLDHLYGPIAFAVCDAASGKLFAARTMERGPAIYVHENAARIVLSTSTKPIFCDPAVPRELDEMRLADELVLNHEDRSRSFFKGVGIVPSGHVLRAAPDGFSVSQQYHLDQVRDVRFARNEDYVEAARELLHRAVATAMRACETPALSLSSGLDSATLAITMLEVLGAEGSAHELPLHCFTAVPCAQWDSRSRPGHAGDERDPVEALMRAYPGLHVTFVPAEHATFDHGVDLIQSYADVPLRGVGNTGWGFEIAQQCRQSGRRVMLTGASGNGTVSMAANGVIFGTWMRQGRWVHALRENHAAMRDARGGGYLKLLAGRVLGTSIPDWLYNRTLGPKRGFGGMGFGAMSAIHPDYARQMGVAERMAQHGWDDRYRIPRTRRELMEIMVRRGMRDASGALSQAVRAIHGIEGRDPLGDRRLLEFCYAVPDEQFFQNGQDRSLIKRVMAGKLPRAILDAPRGEQSADWHARMTRDLPRIAAEIERLADDPIMAERLDIDRMRRAVRDWPRQTPVSLADHPDASFLRYALGRGLAAARFIHQVEGRN